MNLRLTKSEDLIKIKEMYNKIIENMYKNNIKIWDEYYPCELFSNDIDNNNLYVIENDKDIVSAFVLCNSNKGENSLEFTECKNVYYIDRLGVNVNYLNQGIGKMTINKIIELAKLNKIDYLRLFVVDVNIPAINLYLKCGFKKIDGIYEEKIDKNLTLIEYGFELNLKEKK